MPHINLVQNLGMGTINATQQSPFPTSIQELAFPLTNKCKTRDLDFERKYYENTNLSIFRKIKVFLKNIL